MRHETWIRCTKELPQGGVQARSCISLPRRCWGASALRSVECAGPTAEGSGSRGRVRAGVGRGRAALLQRLEEGRRRLSLLGCWRADVRSRTPPERTRAKRKSERRALEKGQLSMVNEEGKEEAQRNLCQPRSLAQGDRGSLWALPTFGPLQTLLYPGDRVLLYPLAIPWRPRVRKILFFFRFFPKYCMVHCLGEETHPNFCGWRKLIL